MVDSVKLEHFRNLVSLCAADGKIDQAERNSLLKIAKSLGIADDRLDVMLAHAHEYIYLVPQNNEDRETQLQAMVDIALVDGEFSMAERELIKSVAHKLGYSPQEAEDLIDGYLKGIPPLPS